MWCDEWQTGHQRRPTTPPSETTPDLRTTPTGADAEAVDSKRLGTWQYSTTRHRFETTWQCWTTESPRDPSGDCFFLCVRPPFVATPFRYSALVPHCFLQKSNPVSTIDRVAVILCIRAVYYWLYLHCHMCFVRISRSSYVNYFASYIPWLILNRGLEG